MPSLLQPSRPGASRQGFTLVEMLVSIAVLAIIMVLAAQMIGDTEKLWKTTSAKIDSFQGARAGFELMTDQLRQATVNTYYDYFNSSGQTLEQWSSANGGANAANSDVSYQASTYGRNSELHFISGPVGGSSVVTAASPSLSVGPDLSSLSGPTGVQAVTQGVFFQAPQDYTSTASSYGALQTLLNASGFFIEFGPDINGTNSWVVNGPPTNLFTNYTPVYRYRLMQFIQPTENLAVYNYSGTTSTPPNAWFTTPITTSHSTCVRIVADNVIGLIIWPKQTDTTTDTLTTNYVYDSRLGENSGVTTAWQPSATGGSGTQPLQMNQMAPILRVAMITIDEPSAKQLQGNSTSQPTQISGAFTATNTTTGVKVFTNPVNMDSDLLYLQTELNAIVPKIQYRIFDTTIAVRSAKFSSLGK